MSMSQIEPISEELSAKLSNMSFVCACLVVSIHVWPHPLSGAAGLIDKILSGGVSRIAVPSFFCISGFLIVPKIAEGKWRLETLKRIHTLLIPYFIWGLINLCALMSLAILNDICQHRAIGTTFWSGRQVDELIIDYLGLNFTKMPLCEPLWYLRNLFFLVLTSPVLYWVIRRRRMVWVVS